MCEKSALRVNVVQSTLWTTLPVSAALLIMSEWVCVVSQRDIRCVDSAVVERFSLTHECVNNIILLASKDDSVLFGLNKHQWDRFTQTWRYLLLHLSLSFQTHLIFFLLWNTKEVLLTLHIMKVNDEKTP